LSLEAVQREIAGVEKKKPKYRRDHKYRPSGQENSLTDRNDISRQAENNSPVIAAVPQGVYRAEKMLLRLILDNPSFLETVEKQLGGDFWSVAEYQKIFLNLKESRQNFSGLIRVDQEDEVQSKLANLIMEEIDFSQPERIMADCIRVIRAAQREESMTELQIRMASMEKTGDIQGAMDLLREIGERLKRGEM